MIKFIEQALASPVGSFAFVFAILVFIGWAIHFITKIIVKHNGFEVKVQSVDAHIDEIRKDLAYIKGNIDNALGKRERYTQRRSPISLTDEGIKLVSDNKLDEIIAHNWDKIYETMRKTNITNPYDIQQYLFENVFVSPEMFFCGSDVNKVKIIAYRQGLALMELMRVISIIIRDKYFEQCGIAISDVDKYDPATPNM